MPVAVSAARARGDGSGGFEQSEQRAAEEADLLAGDDGAGSGAETLDVGEDFRAGAEGL